MGPTNPRRRRALLALGAAGAVALGLSAASPPRKKRKEPPPPKVEETVGDLAFIASRGETKLEGVGLVVGLDNTGVDPPPSAWRSRLVDDMRRAGVEHPNQWLKDPRCAMVLVKLTITAGATPRDRLDATVELPPASGTKSLAGGTLLACRLREVMVLGGSMHEGLDAATVQGPVMTGSVAEPDNVKIGRVLGGGRIRKAVPFRIILNENRRSGRVSAMVESVVNQRFPQTDGVEQKGSAVAKTDGYLELKVPAVYHQNQDRFFRVVKLLPMVDSPTLRSQRTAAWGRDLLDPKKAGIAALRLEGLGPNAIDSLKAGLASPNAQVRFFAAEALAFLNDPSGAEVLGQAARAMPGFRGPALAALAANDQSAFHLVLRKLMDEPDVEVRYGAFNALRTLAPDDAFLGRVRVLEDPRADEDEEPADSMAVALARASSSRRREDPFALYLVDCEGPPMVHVARTRRCELVVFGRGQKLLPPLVLGNGPYLLNASDGDQAVQLSKIVPSRFGEADAKVEASLELGDVLRRTANLGATYPEVVALLQAAARQRNLAGPLVVDAVPGTSPEYLKAEILGHDATAKKDDAVKTAGGEAAKERPARRGLIDRLRFWRDK
jgi:hypothetical protein